MRSHVPGAKIRAQSPVLAVVLLAILVMVSAVLGWLGGLVAWLIVLGALAVFAFCLRARPGPRPRLHSDRESPFPGLLTPGKR